MHTVRAPQCYLARFIIFTLCPIFLQMVPNLSEKWPEQAVNLPTLQIFSVKFLALQLQYSCLTNLVTVSPP